ncbi:MAG: large-conductance mechanosensitive channel protein MscL [Crocinitomicaceae bacterium]|nr:large-conductance mechanosensitive channel protein MscL [Crocinitomicaceae bacterium]
MNEFKKFISKGNVMEMAVGLIMATYFGAIVKSLVNDIIMPPVGILIGGVDFADLKIVLTDAIPAKIDASGSELAAAVPEVAIYYGTFLNTIITFLIVSFAIFIAVKQYNKLKTKLEKKKDEETEKPSEPSKEELLLTEIRDLLKDK